MRFGINTFLFTSPFTNDSTKLFKRFKSWGFDTVEIPIEDPSHIDPAHVKRELDNHGLVCGSVCACMGPDRDLRGTPQQQQTGLDYMMKLIDQMVALDCPSLIGPVYSAVGRADAVRPPNISSNGKQSQGISKHCAAMRRKKGARFAWSRSTVSRPISLTPATRRCEWQRMSPAPPLRFTSTPST